MFKHFLVQIQTYCYVHKIDKAIDMHIQARAYHGMPCNDITKMSGEEVGWLCAPS